MPDSLTTVREPRLWRWVLNIAAAAGLTGIICCVAPIVLFMLGLAGGVWAISFADFFYEGTGNIGVWVLRGLAIVIVIGGILLFHRRQNQCSIDPRRKRRNLILAAVMIIALGTALLVSLERLSAWYFDAYIVPAQQAEYAGQERARAVETLQPLAD